MRPLCVLACLLLGLDPAPALADAAPAPADAPLARADAPPEIAKCAGMANPTERLKCYDAAADRLGFGLPPVREPVTKAEDFGKPAPPPAGPEIRQISATVLEFARTARGSAVFVLDNGQTWRQIDGDSTRVDEPRSGEAMKVTIALGALESYNLAIDGRNASIKVRRLK